MVGDYYNATQIGRQFVVRTLARIPLTTALKRVLRTVGYAHLYYVIEGHVPPEDIERLLAEQPDALGLAVPGMIVGSPGMEVPGAEAQPYDAFLFDASGPMSVFASYNQE